MGVSVAVIVSGTRTGDPSVRVPRIENGADMLK
jgi:hypothetical protein